MLGISTVLALSVHLLGACAAVIEKRQSSQTQYIIYNECPLSIDLYIAGANEGSIVQGGNVTKFLPATAGFFYTDANGGNANGYRTVRAGFYGEASYYYIVRDPDYLNVGMEVQPINHPEDMGFCSSAQCSQDDECSAFDQAPTAFPPSGTNAPEPPVYQCPFSNTTYSITFCPGGEWPDSTARTAIHPGDNQEKCLDVRGDDLKNGTPVHIYDCDGTDGQNWVISRGSTKVQLAGTSFCLDAGSNPGNAVGMKIWQCYDDLPAQQWTYTDDNRIALQNSGLCLDLTNGILANSNRIQTWWCSDNNQNQVWTL